MKVNNINEAVLSANGKLYCAFCKREISSVTEGCTCNKWALMKRNFGLIETAQSQINKYQRIAEEQREHYQGTIDELRERMPEIEYMVRGVVEIVPIQESVLEEPTAEDGGENTDTEGGE